MINIENTADQYFFCIGEHRIPIEMKVIRQFSSALTEVTVPLIANGELATREGNWLVEVAHDDPKSESRARILLHAGDLKWHITKEEAIAIGNLCRSLS